MFARGMSMFVKDVDGSDKVISISDGLGFDITGRTDFQFDSMISNDTSSFEVIAELMTKAGKPTTARELVLDIVNSPDPQKALESFIDRLSPWGADSKIGMPDGWLDMENAGKIISEKMTSAELKTITKVIPGHMETVVSESMKKVIDGRMLAVEVLLAAGGARDLYELARRTKSKEEMAREGTLQRELQPHEKDNKPKVRSYDNNKWGFDGTEKGDRAFLYDEKNLEENAKRGSNIDR